MSDPTATPLAWGVPLAYVIGAAVAFLRPRAAWTAAHAATVAAPILALAALPALSPLAAVMLGLVTVVGAATVRFSHRYLDGRQDAARYPAAFLMTLTGAALVVSARDLAVIGLAWTLTSLALHRLLTLGPVRPAAEVAAHKKFLLSRVADVAVLGAILLLARAFGTTDVATILAAAERGLPTGASVGVTLLAAAIALRSAQLPFHGWLIQVMEAPTPVSALLHAGIINLGAFLAIALSPLFVAAPAAQALLLVAGLGSALLGSLVLLTRGSVKGALAWSTCAQMGFVLVECGIGAYDLALLHLLAHGAYKAHAFLSSGSVVARQARRLPGLERPSALHWGLALVTVPAMILGIATFTWGESLARGATQIGAAWLAIALIPIVADAFAAPGWRARRTALAFMAGLPLLYAVWHAAAAHLVPTLPALTVPAALAWATVPLFALHTALTIAVTAQPSGALARRLYPHAVAGFHLDEVFTRLTFRLWPPTMTAVARVGRPAQDRRAMERAA